MSISENYFQDYDAYTENEILEITAEGIALKNGIFIDFKICADTFGKTNQIDNCKCVAEREITDYSFTFFHLPKPIMIKFIPENQIFEFFSKNDTIHRFHFLQNKITEYGYSTRDMS